MENPPPQQISPPWSSTTKTIIGLSIAGLLVALLFYLRSIIGVLLLAVVLTYLLHPFAKFLSDHTRLSWRASVNITYLFLVILILGTSTAAGFAIVQQAQSLIRLFEGTINNLPDILASMTSNVITFGPFSFDPKQFLDINTLSSQIINIAQPLIGQAGALVGSLAGGAANLATMTVFVILISYFTLVDAGQFPDSTHFFNIPGYTEDIRRISRELRRIWNAFLRGQVTLFFLVSFGYTILLTILGTRYALALGILIGAAQLIPYIGPAISWIALGTVTLLQPQNFFGLNNIQYTVLVLGLSILLDQVYNNLVNPRIMGHHLRINPGAILVVAIISFNLIGVVGLVLAAPVLATVQLLGRYVLLKLADQDPWAEPEFEPSEPIRRVNWITRFWQQVRSGWQNWRNRKSSN